MLELVGKAEELQRGRKHPVDDSLHLVRVAGSAASRAIHVSPWRMWKFSSLATLASARFHGP